MSVIVNVKITWSTSDFVGTIAAVVPPVALPEVRNAVSVSTAELEGATRHRSLCACAKRNDNKHVMTSCRAAVTHLFHAQKILLELSGYF